MVANPSSILAELPTMPLGQAPDRKLNPDIFP